MRIDGSIPMHIAKAYGLRPAAKTAQPSQAAQPSVLGRVAPSSSPVPTHSASKVNQLIAGRVDQPIDLHRTAMASTPNPAGALQLYTRAADRVEAAVGIELGRQLDVKG